MGKDYYKILNLPKDADDEAIKKAYKKSALKWHPDRNKDNQEQANIRFKEVGEAFEVLSDKNKRAVYDTYGEDGLKGGGLPPQGADGATGGFPGGAFGGQGGRTFTFTSGGSAGFSPSDPNDIFASIFGGASPFGGMGGMRGGMGGGNPFSSMGGMGGMGGGRGGMAMNEDMFSGGMPDGFGGGAKPSVVEKHLPCALEDLYKGTTKKLKIGRKLANGGSEEKVLTVEVKAGWKKGTKVRFSGAGNEVSSGKLQDVVFIIDEKPHSKFRRDGDDLRLTIPLSLVDALDPRQASKKAVTALDGRRIEIPIPSPGVGKTTITPGRTSRIAGEGMPISKAPGKKGDLVVEWSVEIPERLSETQRQGVRKALS